MKIIINPEDRANIGHLLEDNKRACQTNKTFAEELSKGSGNLSSHDRKVYIEQYTNLVGFHEGIIKTLEKVLRLVE